jgi:UDP-2-acetamido-2,6-beta-L-arabino-hexul-4-ose reductase
MSENKGIQIIKLDRKGDHRGWLMELFRQENMTNEGDSFGQVYIVLTNPEVVRGNHYHDRKVEWFSAVGGEPWLILEDIETKERTEIDMHDTAVRIPAKVAHAFLNKGNEPTLLIAYISESFNPDDPDTFTYTVI